MTEEKACECGHSFKCHVEAWIELPLYFGCKYPECDCPYYYLEDEADA